MAHGAIMAWIRPESKCHIISSKKKMEKFVDGDRYSVN